MRANPRRTLDAGHLAVQGPRLEFTPPGALRFDARVGEAVELAVRVSFEEGSRLRETLKVRVTARLGARNLGSASCELRDRPFVSDRQTAELRIPVPVMPPGLHEGTLTVEAVSEETSWLGSGEARREAPFSREERFTLHVR